jgi:hypothetical protein
MLDIWPWNNREARPKMDRMRTSSITTISDYEARSRRVGAAAAARRRLDASSSKRREDGRGGGRLWVNGNELGGTDPRHQHLALSFD